MHSGDKASTSKKKETSTSDKKEPSSPKPSEDYQHDDIMHDQESSSGEDEYDVQMARALAESKRQKLDEEAQEKRKLGDLEEQCNMAQALRQSLQEERIFQALLQNIEAPKPLVMDGTTQQHIELMQATIKEFNQDTMTILAIKKPWRNLKASNEKNKKDKKKKKRSNAKKTKAT